MGFTGGTSLEKELTVISFDVGVEESFVIGLDGVRNGLPSLFVMLLLLTVNVGVGSVVLVASQDSGAKDSLVMGFDVDRNGLSSSTTWLLCPPLVVDFAVLGGETTSDGRRWVTVRTLRYRSRRQIPFIKLIAYCTDSLCMNSTKPYPLCFPVSLLKGM